MLVLHRPSNALERPSKVRGRPFQPTNPGRPPGSKNHTPSQRWKRPNALKHGVYAQVPFIPGEDPSEFDKLYADLVGEWQPRGPTLGFAVRGLADSMWRMCRLKKSVQTQLSLTTFDPNSPTFDEAFGLKSFMICLRLETEKCFEERARNHLRADKINYLKQKFPRSNYPSASEWAEAVITEIRLVLLPAAQGFKLELKVDQVKTLRQFAPEFNIDDCNKAAHEWKTEQQVAGCVTYASELLEYDFKETERLEARIARQTRRCAELKAWEEAEEARSKT